jgi:hypothetical protein
MHVQRDLRRFTQRLHHRRAYGNIGDKMPVHHIHVQQVGAGLFDSPDLAVKPAEIRG